MAKEMSHAEIIDALGGVRAVAAATGKSYRAVHNWKNAPNRRIPDDFKVRAAIARLAAECGVALPTHEFPAVGKAA